MENHIIDLIKKSLIHFDNQNKKYNKYLKNTIINASNVSTKITNINTGEDVDSMVRFEREILGIFNHQTNVFIWSWSLPYLGMDETIISKKLLYYGLKLVPNSNTVSHYYIKTLLINARNYIESDFDLDLILAISSYILKDNYSFIYPKKIYNTQKEIIMTSFTLIKIQS